MAKIDVAQFLGKAKTYTIAGQLVSVEPLMGKDLDLLVGMKEGKEAEGIKKLVMATLEVTSEEYDKLPVNFINEAVEAILDVNGFSTKQ